MRCQDCPFSSFAHDWRDSRCRMLDPLFFKNDEDHRMARDLYEDEKPDWCPRDSYVYIKY